LLLGTVSESLRLLYRYSWIGGVADIVSLPEASLPPPGEVSKLNDSEPGRRGFHIEGSELLTKVEAEPIASALRWHRSHRNFLSRDRFRGGSFGSRCAWSRQRM
jgi:hypothetical protein